MWPCKSPYKSDKAVPWRYTTQGPNGREDASVVCAKDDLSSAKVTKISDISGMTHSGQIFMAPKPPMRSKDLKGKTKAGMEDSVKESPILDEEVPVERFAKEEEDFRKKEYPLKKQLSSCESSSKASSR